MSTIDTILHAEWSIDPVIGVIVVSLALVAASIMRMLS